MVLDHELVFVSPHSPSSLPHPFLTTIQMNGDMNYRIEHRRDFVIAAIKAGEIEGLLAYDQLLREMKNNRAFRLRSFQEGPLTFPPTYKYDRRSDEFDSSEKARTPAWCDRVLWRSQIPGRVEQVHYRRWEANVSDHRPISAGFRMSVKSVKKDARERVKMEERERWKVVERRLLSAARQYYIDQRMI